MIARSFLPLVLASSLLGCSVAFAQTPARSDADLSYPLWSIPLSSLTATRERPLFTPGRRPPGAPQAPPPMAAAAPAPPAPPEAPPFDLMGTLVSDEERIAVVFDKTTGQPVRLRPGGTAAGWSLKSVGPRSAVVVRGGASVTLNMPSRASTSGGPIPRPVPNPDL